MFFNVPISNPLLKIHAMIHIKMTYQGTYYKIPDKFSGPLNIFYNSTVDTAEWDHFGPWGNLIYFLHRVFAIERQLGLDQSWSV